MDKLNKIGNLRRKYTRIVNNAYPSLYQKIKAELPTYYDNDTENYETDWLSVQGLIGCALTIAGSDRLGNQYDYAVFCTESLPKLDNYLQVFIWSWFDAIQQTAQYYDLIWQD